MQNLKNYQHLRDPSEYMSQVYGDPLAYLQETTKFVTEREYYEDFGYGECFNSTESEVQVSLRNFQIATVNFIFVCNCILFPVFEIFVIYIEVFQL